MGRRGVARRGQTGKEEPLRSIRTYSIKYRDSPAVLLRIVGACWRRRLRLVALDYATGDTGPARLLVSVLADETDERRLLTWLGNLVDVEAIVCVDRSATRSVERRGSEHTEPLRARQMTLGRWTTGVPTSESPNGPHGDGLLEEEL